MLVRGMVPTPGPPEEQAKGEVMEATATEDAKIRRLHGFEKRAKLLADYASEDEYRQSLQGIHVRDGLIFATDGHVLAAYRVDQFSELEGIEPGRYRLVKAPGWGRGLLLDPTGTPGPDVKPLIEKAWDKATHRYEDEVGEEGTPKRAAFFYRLALLGCFINPHLFSDRYLPLVKSTVMAQADTPHSPVRVDFEDGLIVVAMPFKPEAGKPIVRQEPLAPSDGGAAGADSAKTGPEAGA